jgi:hypothetical protein
MTDPKDMDFREWYKFSDTCPHIRTVEGNAMCQKQPGYCYYSGCPLRKGEE